MTGRLILALVMFAIAVWLVNQTNDTLNTIGWLVVVLSILNLIYWLIDPFRRR